MLVVRAGWALWHLALWDPQCTYHDGFYCKRTGPVLSRRDGSVRQHHTSRAGWVETRTRVSNPGPDAQAGFLDGDGRSR